MRSAGAGAPAIVIPVSWRRRTRAASASLAGARVRGIVSEHRAHRGRAEARGGKFGGDAAGTGAAHPAQGVIQCGKISRDGSGRGVQLRPARDDSEARVGRRELLDAHGDAHPLLLADFVQGRGDEGRVHGTSRERFEPLGDTAHFDHLVRCALVLSCSIRQASTSEPGHHGVGDHGESVRRGIDREPDGIELIQRPQARPEQQGEVGGRLDLADEHDVGSRRAPGKEVVGRGDGDIDSVLREVGLLCARGRHRGRDHLKAGPREVAHALRDTRHRGHHKDRLPHSYHGQLSSREHNRNVTCGGHCDPSRTALE